MTAQSERQMQSTLLRLLELQGYTRLPGNQTIESHEGAFRTEVERINGLSFSVAEHDRLKAKLKLSMAEAFTTLRHGVQLSMDDGSTKVVKFYDTKDYTRNKFQVAEEVRVQGAVNRRLDVVIFLNGLPIVAGELKKLGSAKGINGALDDINVYTREGVYRVGLLRFVQLYFASDGATTKYFATSLGAEHQEAYTNPFYWADRLNKRVLRLNASPQEYGWSNTFFTAESLFKLIHFNMLMTSGRDRRIIALRPYQFYAVEDGLERVVTQDDGGFFWHATGSGKTLTSFMLSQAILGAGHHKKVVMILDRNDLANQTVEEFASFGSAAGVVSKGRNLTEALADPGQTFVLTTMQSMAALLKRKYKKNKISTLFDESVVFVVDECHRSTFGDQFKSIRKTFPRAQFVGFTGTPILDENVRAGDNRLTRTLFGDPIHIYTMKDAIDDGNVLPFKEYEVDFGGLRDGRDIIDSDEWKVTVANYIAEHLVKHTQQKNLGLSPVKDDSFPGGYTALLAAPLVKDAYQYWRLMTPLLEAQGRTCATIFSGISDEGKDRATNGQEWHGEVFAHYDKAFGTSFASDEDPDVLKSYLADLTRRIKNKEIDLVIVASMLLTGFDAKTLNTVYLDKNLHHHSLVQAMSRGNRTHKDPSKQFGNVVLFKERSMKDKVDDAIRLFSNGRSIEGVVDRKDFAEAFAATREAANTLRGLSPTPSHIDNLQEATDLVPVARAYTALSTALRLLKTYDEWDDSKSDYAKVGVSELEVDEYYSFLLEAKSRILEADEADEDQLAMEDFELALRRIATYSIDVAYINELLRNAVFAPPAQRKQWIKKAQRAIEQSDDPEVVKNSEALRGTVEAIESGKVTTDKQVFEDLDARKAKLREARMLVYSDELRITEGQLDRLVRQYELTGQAPLADYNKMLSLAKIGLMEKRKLSANLDKIMEELSR